MTRPRPLPPPPRPIGDGSRDSSGAAAVGNTPYAPRRCPVCATPLPGTRARYCSAACRQRASSLVPGEHVVAGAE